jgi:hypothetical protein
MTLLNRSLEHCIEIATGEQRNLPPQKSTSWDMAKRYAESCPHELAELPALLKAAMLERNK